ncbi:MAG TPA: beta-galactosidase, partial [Opitutus sp.]|nr:beta-galactosidase [Opitutus sp.]
MKTDGKGKPILGRGWADRPVAAMLGSLSIWVGSCIPPAEPEEPNAWSSVAIGLCEDYPEETRSLARARKDLIAAREAGAAVLRIAFGWDAIEPERGVHDWSFWDEFVPMAAREFGLRLIPYVCYTPRWAATDAGPEHWRSPPRDAEDFGRFMAV